VTTIAYDGKTLAADSRLTSCNNAPAGEVTKAWSTPDGSLWAHSGAGQDYERLRQWAEGNREGPAPELDEGVLVHITPAGLVRQWWGKGWLEARAEQFAWGSGERIARGAMLAGADARRAVEIASVLDTDTGGEIVVLTQPLANQP
jgi:hypothetical protein